MTNYVTASCRIDDLSGRNSTGALTCPVTGTLIRVYGNLQGTGCIGETLRVNGYISGTLVAQVIVPPISGNGPYFTQGDTAVLSVSVTSGDTLSFVPTGATNHPATAPCQIMAIFTY